MSKSLYYIVESGNWKVRVKVENMGEYAYIEAGTRAIEAVFGKKELDQDCEIISLMTEEGKDYFDLDVADDKIPQPMFSIVTGVCHKSYMDKQPRFYLTRELFENAGQPVNAELAKKAEASEPDQVKRFLELRKKKTIRKKKA